jgi:predicted nucleic acid-binding protein
MRAFLDTNVILRYLLRDDEAKYQSCRGLLKSVEEGEEELVTTDLVVAELVWVMSSKPYELSRARIRDDLSSLISLGNLRLPHKPLLERALDLYAESGIDFIDAYNAVAMLKRGVESVYSYDTDFDKLPGLARQEP